MNPIDRREFLRQAGVFVTVPIFLNTFGPYIKPLLADPNAAIIPDDLNTPILKSLGIGITAPNPHNTQAWKFKITNEYECSLYVDENRILPETDPTTRQIHIGQGTFLEILSIGAGTLGFESNITYFPEGSYDVNKVGLKPVANIQLIKSTTQTLDPLKDSISKRQTTRTKYSGPLITGAEFAQIHSLVNPRDTALVFINQTSEMEPLIKLFIQAMEIETNIHRTYDESKKWFRFSDEEIARFNDGISLSSNGMSGLFKWVAETFFLSPETWHSASNKTSGLNAFRKAVESSRGFVYIKTDTNTPLDWVKSGRAYSRLNLAATKLGLALHPLSQVLQEFPEMKATRVEFNSRLGIKEPAKIQMIARLGRSPYQYYQPRRSVKSMLLN